MKLLLGTVLIASVTMTSLAWADFGLSDLQSAAKSATSDGNSAGDSASRFKSLSDKAVIHLNSASESDLTKLPGITPTQAQAIIKARPFNSLQDLSKVPGLKEAAVAKLKGLVAL